MSKLVLLFLILLSASPFEFATPSFAQSNELIVNGGFETGEFDGWKVGRDCFLVTNPLASHSGSHMARVGSPNSWSTLSQKISIPDQATITLSFWYLVQKYARLTASLKTTGGSVIQSWQATDDSIWHEISFQLEPAHGETYLIIEFKGVGYREIEYGPFADRWIYIRVAFVDDVSLIVSSKPIPEFEIVPFVMVIGIVATLVILKRRRI